MQDFGNALAAAFGTGPGEVPELAIDRLDGPAIVSAQVQLCVHPAGPVLGSVSPCLAPAAG
ncbi:hypothetical protein [Amycolatopsis vancoresmycina]|uniref:Uncharacterized protein n=1 Tax=Amycolatopsis vancoresmycina DSM 44592 TaxID=1292037 RepID=R1ICZ6_9PSEU|nr:hypothetical protein [Amycolatopsis vancoresmycina]EOD70386.1 hypothetical protein H480_01212 [Amycolatopsis vancoresmycina DSM 44592]